MPILLSPRSPGSLHSYIFLLILGCIFWHPDCSAQIPYTRLSVEDGLSNNSVQCILQDNTGVVWIGTTAGLNRYDGASFITYNILSRPALSNSVVTALIEDDKGNIWVGTENGLNILDPVGNKIRQFIHNNNDPASLPAGPVREIQKMKDGSIWVLSESWFAKYTGIDTFLKIAVDPKLWDASKVFAGLYEEANDRLWVSYLDQPTALAKKYPGKSGQDSIAALDSQWPGYEKVLTDRGDTAWGISYKGVTLYDKKSRHYTSWLQNKGCPDIPNLHIHTCFSMDANGNIWQGSQGINLVQYNLHQKIVTDFNWLLSSCKATMVYCIYTDQSNTVWIGTDNGIIKLSNRAAVFRNIVFRDKQEEMKNIRCRRLLEDKKGVVYAGTENYGFMKLLPSPGGQYTTVPLSRFGALPVSALPVKNNKIRAELNGHIDIGYIYDMWFENDNTLWLTGYGLARYDTRHSKIEIFLAGGNEVMQQESITQFSICPDDSLIWTGGQHNLFTFNTTTKQMKPFRDNTGNMPFHELPCWSLAKTGTWLWAGTDKGLFKINMTTREVTKEYPNPALRLAINDIYIDKDSSLWISTAGGGVLHYNTQTGSVKQYTSLDGLSNNTVCGTLPDAENNLWFSTYAGLSHLDRKTGLFTCFYARHGLNGDEFNRKAFGSLHNGDLIFGGLNGYNVFNAKNAFYPYKQASLLLTSFSKTTETGIVKETIFGANQLKEIVLDPGDKFFSFTYTLTNMYDPFGNTYSYMLSGLDNTWHSIGNQHTISFISLPAGNYTLRVKGFSDKYLAAKDEAHISITVKQVFYKSTWFIVLLALTIAAVFYGIARYRIDQLKKLQVLRTRIASDLHDEVGNVLVRITMLADAGKRANDKNNIHEQLASIAGISRGAISTMKDVIWNIDARNDSMGGMISHMHEHIYNMLTPAGIEFSFLHADVPDDVKPGMHFRQNVYLIFKEAINNIVKHADASFIQVSLQLRRRLFTMTIADNGHGVIDDQQKGQGLRNMKMRADRLKGKLEIISKEGVVISLEVPM